MFVNVLNICKRKRKFSSELLMMMMMMMMMMMIMMMMVIVFADWLTGKRCLVLFKAGTITRDSHHCKSLKRSKQDFNLRRILSSGFVEWNCAVVITTLGISLTKVLVYSKGKGSWASEISPYTFFKELIFQRYFYKLCSLFCQLICCLCDWFDWNGLLEIKNILLKWYLNDWK